MPVTEGGGGYRLPRTIELRLAAAARDLRNGEAVLALARFLARFHTAPAVLGRAFTVDRVALAGHDGHGLTESRVRGALAALEAVGFLIREAMPGSAYRPTEAGLRRKPILFRIAPEFGTLFERANAAARRARGGGKTDRRPVTPSPAPRTPTPLVSHPTAQPEPWSPERKSPSGSVLFRGPESEGSETGLEAALSRLRIALERSAA